MSNQSIVAVVEDLFFTVKIQDAAKRSGLSCVFVKTREKAMEKAKADRPRLIIIDLNAASVEPLELIRAFKEDEETKDIDLLGFVSHVQGELKQKAHAAGCDSVLARSAFSQNLNQILKRYAGAAA